MAGTITTTLVVSFGDPSAAATKFLSAEIDSRPDGFNKGITSFIIGDNPVFLVFRSADLTISKMEKTAGSIGGMGQDQVQQVETISFTKTREATLSKPPSGAVTWLRVGGEGPTPTLQPGTNVVTVPQPVLAVWQATYNATADVYRLSGVGRVPGVLNVQVIVFIEGQ